jgi:hypothetical protein
MPLMLTVLLHDIPTPAMLFILVTAQSRGYLGSSNLLQPLPLKRSIWYYPLLLDKPPGTNTASSSSNSRFKSVLNATTNRELNWLKILFYINVPNTLMSIITSLANTSCLVHLPLNMFSLMTMLPIS